MSPRASLRSSGVLLRSSGVMLMSSGVMLIKVFRSFVFCGIWHSSTNGFCKQLSFLLHYKL